VVLEKLNRFFYHHKRQTFRDFMIAAISQTFVKSGRWPGGFSQSYNATNFIVISGDVAVDPRGPAVRAGTLDERFTALIFIAV